MFSHKHLLQAARALFNSTRCSFVGLGLDVSLPLQSWVCTNPSRNLKNLKNEVWDDMQDGFSSYFACDGFFGLFRSRKKEQSFRHERDREGEEDRELTEGR